MSALGEILGHLLERDPSLVVGVGPRGEVLYRSGVVLAGRMEAQAATARLARWIQAEEPLADLGLVRIHLKSGVDPLAVHEQEPTLVQPVHVLTLTQAVAVPSRSKEAAAQVSRRLRQQLGRAVGLIGTRSPVRHSGETIEEYVDEVQLARMLSAGASHKVSAGDVASSLFLIPYAGWSVDDRQFRAISEPSGSTSPIRFLAPAGDMASSRPVFPAADSWVTAVASTDDDMRALTPTSGWGLWVNVAAPGGANEPAAGTLWAAATVAAFLSTPGNEPSLRFPSLEGRSVVHIERPGEAETGARSRQSWDWDLEELLSQRAGGDLSLGHHLARDKLLSTRGIPHASASTRDGALLAGVDTEDVRQGRGEEKQPEEERPEPMQPSREEQQWAKEHWLVSTRLLNADGHAIEASRCLLTSADFALQVVIGYSAPPAALDQSPSPLSLEAAPPGVTLDMCVLPLGPGLRVVGSPSTCLTLSQNDPGSRVSVSAEVHVRTSSEPGTRRMRCNLYHRGNLLQSHLITVEVRDRNTHRVGALRAELDFNVSSTLDADYLRDLQPVALSLFLNSGDEGKTHDLVYRGTDGAARLVGGFVLDGLGVTKAISDMRERLRSISWGARTPWKDENPRYESAVSEAEFFADLANLALGGYHLWGALFPQLAEMAGTPSASRDEIRALARAPGSIELGCRDSLRMTIPVSLLYDRALDDAFVPSLCQAFVDGYRAQTDFAVHRCFMGDCPSQNDPRVVCPSGFWGLRHRVCVVRSVTPAGVDSAVTLAAMTGRSQTSAVSGLPVQGSAGGLAASTTDVIFGHRADHLKTMRELFKGELEVVENRDSALNRMAESDIQVVYFFCHGVSTPDGYPGLVVGPKDGPAITLNNFGERIRWHRARPLVFLNGCQTTALQPDNIFDMVTTLVQECGASGVVGTETTVFEATAEKFAEAFHAAFVRDRAPIGEAVRLARLQLLSRGNPLGFLYAPYAPVSLRLLDAPD